MASAGSRREYELMFRLSAQVNGAYTNTFRSAQTAVSTLQREIQQLNSRQGDISAYQKQQTAVENTGKKLEMLQRQYDNIQREIQETGGYSSDLENKLIAKQQQIEKTNAALGQQTDKLNRMGEALREAGVDTGNLEAESRELESELQSLRGRQEEAAESAGTFGERSAEAMNAAASAIAAAGIAVALKEIAGAYMECINAAGGFEETMSTVEALSGATASEIESLSVEAKRLGAETQYTAQESAEAMTYMAMAGWGTTDMLQGMSGVIQLAAASGEDLARVSDIVTDALTAFGLSASDTAHFADVLATTATGANTSVGLMGETFKYAAPLAGALGYSVEDVATMIGLMANSGIKSTQAGTALRTMFSKLTDGATLTSVAFGEIDIETQNADGSMRGLGEIITELRARFEQMTEAEKIYNAQQLVGQEAMSGFVTLMNAADGDFEKLSKSINNCTGAASKMSKIKMDNMNGQLKLMQSAWEGVTLAVGEQFTPAMGELYKVAAQVFTKMKEFIEKHPALIKAVTAFIAVVGAVTAGIMGYAAAAKIAAAASALLSASIPGLNIIMAVTVGVAALTAGIVALVSAANDGVPSVKELTEAAREMNTAMEEAKGEYEETSTSMAATANVAESYINRLEEIEAATGGNVEGNKEYHNILELLTRTIPELADSIDLETDSIEGGTEALRRQTEAWKINAEAQARQEYINSLYDEYGAVMTEAAENSIKLTEAQIKERTATEKMEAAQVRMNEIWQEAEKKAKENAEAGIAYADTTAYLTEEYYELQNSLYEYDSEVYTAQKEQKNLQKAIEEDSAAVAEAEEVIKSAEAAIAEMTAEETAAAEKARLLEEQQTAVAESAGLVRQEAELLVEAYNEAYRAANESISGQYALWDQAAEVVKKSAADINSAMQSQTAYWQEYNTNLKSLSERSTEIEGLSNVIASFADGSQESVNAIAGMASASDEELAAMVQNWKSLQEEQDAASGSIAELKTNFTAEMDALGTELAADIKAMNLGTEAKESARATIQGFIDGAKEMSPQVQTAYAGIAAQARAALNTGSGSGGKGNVRGYATGTESAERGFAMVGENGPELMFMNGGEKILNAAETKKAREEFAAAKREMMETDAQAVAYNRAQEAKAATGVTNNAGDTRIEIQNSPTIYVNGDQPGDLEAKLEENNQKLLKQVENLLDEKADKRERQRYD